MKVFVGSDYRGFEAKVHLVKFLRSAGFLVEDEGDYGPSEESDYNDAAVRVAKAVRGEPASRGILICGSAHGMTIQANRFKGIRAINADTTDSARLGREHDDANILCLSAQLMTPKEIEAVALAFLETNFSNLERRVRRINRLDEREDYD